MTDIFREVDEALKQEKVQKFWNEYGQTLIAAAIVLVASTAIGVGFKSWNASRQETETARLVSAIDSSYPLSELTKMIDDTRSGPEVIARFTAASLHQEKGGKDKAAALYKEAAEDHATPKDMRDLARIMYVRVSPDATPDEKSAILMPVLERKQSPFYWQAAIEAAMAAGAKEDYSKAVGYLEGIEETSGNPPSLVDRANALRHVYEMKETQAAGAQANDEASE